MMVAYSRCAVRGAALVATMLAVAGCAETTQTTLPTGAGAYETLNAAPEQGEYTIAPLDVLSVTVFLEPELSNPELTVTSNGRIALPLTGEIMASGLTTGQLGDEIRSRLSTYIQEPEVSVLLVQSSGMRVTVEGSVINPGIYPLTGRTGLLDIVALAKGPTETAKLDQAIILRTVEGRQYGAVFDLGAIRAGAQPDPQLRGGDQVVIGLDGVKASVRQALQAAPLASVFRVLY